MAIAGPARYFAVLLLCVSAHSIPASADVYLHLTETLVRPRGPDEKSNASAERIYLDEGKVRIEWSNGSLILRLDKGEIYLLLHGRKTLQRISLSASFEDLVEDEVWDQSESVRSHLFEMETATISPTGERKEFGYWKAEGYEIVVHDEFGNKEDEAILWVSRDIGVDVSLYKELIRSYSRVSDYGESQWIDDLLALDGFVVSQEWTRYGPRGVVTTTKTLESVSEVEVPADFYDPPADYEEIPYHSAYFIGFDEM